MALQKFSTLLVIFVCFLIGINSVSINAQEVDVMNPKKRPNTTRRQPVKKTPKTSPTVVRETVVKYKKPSTLVITSLPATNISLTSIDRKKLFNKTDKVDSEGNLILDELPPGKYKLTSSLEGYKSQETEILILPEKTQVKNIYLDLLSSNLTTEANVTEGRESTKSPAVKKIKDPATIESESWELVRNSTDTKDFDSFLKEFPRGANAAKAKIRREQVIWESVKDSEDIKKIQDYLKEFPKGKNAILAKNRLQQLVKSVATTNTNLPSNTNAGVKQPVLTGNKAVKIAEKEPAKTENQPADNNLQKNSNSNSAQAKPNQNDKTTSKNVIPANTNQNPVIVDKSAVAGSLSAKEYLKECQENIKLEKLNEALQSCTNAIDIDPKQELGYVLRGNIYSVKTDFNLAVEDYSKAINLNPTNPTNFFNRGNAFFRGNNYSEAIKDYAKAIEINPENPIYYSNRGFAHTNKKDFTKAISDFTVAIGLNYMPASVFITRGQAYFALDEFNEAIADYSRAIILNPNNANVYRERSRAYQARANKTNKTKERSSDLEKAELDNKSAEALEKQNP